MKQLTDFVPLLGPRLRDGGGDGLRALAERWGVEFPADLVEILAAYGDSFIADHITLYGPGTLEKMSSYRRSGEFPLGLDDTVARPVFPRPGGLLEWATSSTGDAFCVQKREHGDWAVSTYDQLAFEWLDYDLGFSEWLYVALSGEAEFDILPPFDESRPLSVVPLDIDRDPVTQPLGAPLRRRHYLFRRRLVGRGSCNW